MSKSTTSRNYFTIQGNIGCGKSTFLKIIGNYFPQVQQLFQPVQDWRNVNNTGVNILQYYYNDSSRWGLTFLNYALFTRLFGYKQMKKQYPESIIISQRSPQSDKYIFFQLMKDLNTLNQAQMVLFDKIYEGQNVMIECEKPRIIYLRSTPEICKQRTQKRQRSQQATIPLQYFEKLHQKHEMWMKQQLQENVLVIDASVQFEKDEDRIKEIIGKIEQFIMQKNVN